MSSIGERIKIRRKEIGMSAKELGEIIGKTESTIFRYEKGRISNVDSNIIVPIAEALRTTPAYLMGWDDESTSRKKVSNIIQFDQLAHHKIPLAGSVAGGEPIYDEEVDLFIDGPTKASYAVRLKGHSMEPLYKDGDIIYVREQPDVHNGQIAVVAIDGEATLKQVYHIPNGLQLISENHDYPPIIATFDEYNDIRIMGIPVGYTRMYESNVKIPFGKGMKK